MAQISGKKFPEQCSFTTNILYPLHTFTNKIMPEIVPGYTTENKTVTVPNNDTDINAEITNQAADGWVSVQLTISGSDMIILFTRTQQAS